MISSWSSKKSPKCIVCSFVFISLRIFSGSGLCWQSSKLESCKAKFIERRLSCFVLFIIVYIGEGLRRVCKAKGYMYLSIARIIPVT